MKRRAILAVAAGTTAIIAAAAVIPSLKGLVDSRGVPVFEVDRESFHRSVVAEGNLKAVDATPLTAPVEAQGPLKIAWIAPDGSRVAAGDVVVRFDPTDKEKELADGKADRATADEKIVKREAEQKATLRNLDRDAGHSRLELERARTFQSKDPEIFSRVEIIESQIDENLASRRVEHATSTRETKESLSRTDLALLAIERHKADLKIRQGERGLRSLEMTAPHDGILTLERDWRGNTPRVGETVWSGEPLAEIPDLTAMEAEVFVLEADAGGLTTGLPATVMLEAQPDRVYNAKVRRVDALAKPRFRGVPVQYFGLTLELERTEPAVMKPGQRLRATLALDERKDAFAVPREAIFEKDGKKIVYRRRGFAFEVVEVTLGPSALGRVVVERGLEKGDLIALRDPTRPAEEVRPPSEKEMPVAPALPLPGEAG